jgi:ubiquitin-protein ligase
MSSVKVKRILSDIRYLSKNKLDNGENNIWVKYDETNLEIMYAMIKGSDDTPYKGGFYFFEILFPKTYPLKNPSVNFCTLDPRVRFNPNLYRKGKVCLSLLGTWSGPGWTACNNVASVLLSIQSMVLNDMPLRNEPGYENATMAELQRYNYVVEYFNYEVATLGMLHNPPGVFKMFNDEIREVVFKNKQTYLNNIMKLRENIMKPVKSMYKDKNMLKETEIDVVLYPLHKSENYMNSGVYNMILYPDFEMLYAKIDSLTEKAVSDECEIGGVTLEIICLRNKITKSTTIYHISELAKKIGIDKCKISEKTNKVIKKTKFELLSEIDTAIEKLNSSAVV